MLGPLIGFPGPGKRGHCTVAKLARAIVAGSVRRTVESRVSEIQVRTRRTHFPLLADLQSCYWVGLVYQSYQCPLAAHSL